jgi:hypothetical protein
MSRLTSMIRRVVWSRTIFEFWQSLGVDVTKKHFSSPIPDLKELARREDLWTQERTAVGLDVNLDGQLHFLDEIFPRYKNELTFALNRTGVPHEYYLNNSGFGLEDAGVLHCMIRHFKPRTILEIGSGNSTLVSARAALMNDKEGFPCSLTAVDPYPRKYLRDGVPGFDQLIIEKLEQADTGLFEQLGENDILFIDSSHVLRAGNDVKILYLDILPTLKKGVVIHSHDVFLPYDYPRQWVIELMNFWTENYVLQAFLCLNEEFEVLFGNHCMMLNYPEKMQAFFPRPQNYRDHIPTSFWFRRKPAVSGGSVG